jgi:hypothetical protein
MAGTSAKLPAFDIATSDLPAKRLEHDMIFQHDISRRRDIETVYLSPSSFLDAFEEEIYLCHFNATKFPIAGLECEEKNGKVYLRQMILSSPAAKIRAWRSRLRDARIISINDNPVNCIRDISDVFLLLAAAGAQKATILMQHSAIRDGLVESGIPQVNVDQLNSCFAFDDIEVMSQEQFDRWFFSLPTCFYELVEDGGVLNLTTACHKLMRRVLLQQDDWDEWEQSEWKQLDAYEKQFMFGTPILRKKDFTVFNLIWTYMIKAEDGRKKGLLHL